MTSAHKTERLYYTDSALREFDARVLEAKEGSEGCRVYLDRTAFYPASGGQPSDWGTLDGMKVLDLIDEGAGVAHILERDPASPAVHGAVDWQRRFDHMQQHTGQHILSAAVEATARLKTVSFHMGEEASSIDLDSDRVSQRQIEEAESLANQVVFEDRLVHVFFRQAEETQHMDLRKPTAREGEVRLVQVENFDLSACGGTHVSRTGAIGLILVRKIERVRQQTRLEFLCGGRCLRAARADFRLLTEAGLVLSAAPAQVPELVKKQAGEMREALKTNEDLTRRVAQYRASELWLSAPESGGRRIVRQIFEAAEKLEAKMIAQAAGALDSCVFLVGIRGKPATFYFAQSAGGVADMGALVKKTCATFSGKGGGTRDFAQGGGMDEAKMEEALKYAENALNSKL
jgi:alanyl-tRNA synthetase